MRNVLFLLISLLALIGCKHKSNEIPAPVSPLDFTILADSIKLNPNGYTPLSALVNFSTPLAGKTFIRVRGKHGKLTTIEHTFNDSGIHHSIPVIGLYANYANLIDIRIINRVHFKSTRK